MEVSVSGSSTVLQSGGTENAFGESLQGDTTSPVDTETESSNGIVIFGVRREDPWSDATKSVPLGYFALMLVTVLALVPPYL